MSHRTRRIGCLAVAGFLTQLLFTTAALAHHPVIEAEAICDPGSGAVDIDYTATAWEGDGNPASRENPLVEIYLNGVLVDTGAFEAPDYSFMGSVPAPAGSSAGDVVTVMAVAAGDWGSGPQGGQSRSTTVTIPEDCLEFDNGRFTGGGFQIRVDGARVTRGFTIHCDLLLSNNLEVNWPGGHRFHMTEHLTTVECSDDPAIVQAPPPAPVDTIIGVGTGRYDGEDGYTIEFTLVDAGEPGREDEAAFLIYETADPSNVVLEVVQQVLNGGNIQAHFDQPHR